MGIATPLLTIWLTFELRIIPEAVFIEESHFIQFPELSRFVHVYPDVFGS